MSDTTDDNTTCAIIGIPWRCDKCGGVIAITRDGLCTIPDKSKVVLHNTYISVECPECHKMNDWYLNIVCI